jgi:hypothetical protein
MSTSLLELLELVDSVKIYISEGLYTIEAKLTNGVYLDHDDLSLEQCIMDALTTVQEMQ